MSRSSASVYSEAIRSSHDSRRSGRSRTPASGILADNLEGSEPRNSTNSHSFRAPTPTEPSVHVVAMRQSSSAHSMAIDVQNFRSVFESEDFHSPSSQHPSQGRKYLMLFLFCFAEFMDSFIGSALYPAINVLETDLKVGPAEVTWSFAAYSATFAAFLLISGRVSDVYSAKWTFIAGAILIGAFSLGAGFVHDKVIFFVLRALAGVGAAMTVPSALSLIVQWFPGGDEQARGIALFGGSGALGNVLGVIIGGAFVQWANWRWILWFIAIVGFLIAAISAVTVPPSPNRRVQPSLKRLDPGGVTMITAALVLFVYAATSGSTKGWGNPGVLAPLVVSVVMGLLFFVYEAAIDPSVAALPPYVWGYKNVPILIGLALLPLFWWAALFFQLMPLMQETYHWSPIMTSVHFLPTGICSMAIANFVPTLVRVASPKWAVMIGLGMELAASVLLPFADTPQRYYSFLIPAMIIGTIGTTIVFSGSNIALFMNTPPEMAGVVGGMFNSALQLGLAIGLAVVASITTSVNHSQHSPSSSPSSYYAGIAAGYWFVLGTVGLMTILVLVFYKPEHHPSHSPSLPASGVPHAHNTTDIENRAGVHPGPDMHEMSPRTRSITPGQGRSSHSRSRPPSVASRFHIRNGAQSRMSIVALPAANEEGDDSFDSEEPEDREARRKMDKGEGCDEESVGDGKGDGHSDHDMDPEAGKTAQLEDERPDEYAANADATFDHLVGIAIDDSDIPSDESHPRGELPRVYRSSPAIASSQALAGSLIGPEPHDHAPPSSLSDAHSRSSVSFDVRRTQQIAGEATLLRSSTSS